MDIKILVATHKKYKFPNESIYMPIHVGAEGKSELGYQKDSDGENISNKNKFFCELTGFYWAWKNLNTNYIGFCHYRRYFTNKNRFLIKLNNKNKLNFILNKSDIELLLESGAIVLPNKRKYYIETVESHYKHAHHIDDLKQTRNIIEEQFPAFLDSFDNVMSQNKLHLFNMFIMKKDEFDEYCEWLFAILFELEKRIDTSIYDLYQQRVYGFISERLFNVWIKEKGYRINEVKVINLEKVEWIKKIHSFIMRKWK